MAKEIVEKKEEPAPVSKRAPRASTSTKATRTKKEVSAKPLTIKERLAAKISEIKKDEEEEAEMAPFLSFKEVEELLSNKEKGIRVDTPARDQFIHDCWKYYSGNPLSYVINKHLYLGRKQKLEVGADFTEEDMFLVYDNLFAVRYDIWAYLRSIDETLLRNRSIPYNPNLLMNILIIGLQTTPMLKADDYFLITTKDTRLYRGFRMLNNNDSVLFGKNKSFISTTLDISTALSHAKPVSDTDPSKSILIEYSFTPGIKLIKAAALYEDILITAFSKKEEEHVIMPGYTFTLVEKGTYMVETNSVTLRRSSGEKVTTQVVNTPGYSLPYYHIKVSKS